MKDHSQTPAKQPSWAIDARASVYGEPRHEFPNGDGHKYRIKGRCCVVTGRS
jgi:hypothetical protein